MPKQIADIKKFLVYTKRKDAREIRVKKNSNETKFKLRCSSYLYTLKVSDAKKAEKLRKAFPPTMKVVDIKN